MPLVYNVDKKYRFPFNFKNAGQTESPSKLTNTKLCRKQKKIQKQNVIPVHCPIAKLNPKKEIHLRRGKGEKKGRKRRPERNLVKLVASYPITGST